ncbi:polysaccharide lyase 8 family protein [Streptomyces celluloflavus]|uniref:polysaccharide lyase 8 family protein n=1 Tax=Streptomyces celluloflavus TaxID=58344 RepID=UPI00346117DF|nr:polysaccharide lyase 8 family protein [Streptomyces celluloflavus]
MTHPWTRRSLLITAGGVSLAAGLPAATAATAAAAARTGTGTGPARPAASAADFAALRTTWRELTLGTGFSPTAQPFKDRLATLGADAGRLLASMAPADGSLWPDAVYADPDPNTDPESFGYSERLQTSYVRLRTMAQAYAQPGTGLTGDQALATALRTGLDHLYEQVYNERTIRYGNWYNWQIGAPQALLDSCVLLYDQLATDRITRYLAAVDHFVPDSAVGSYTGTSTGANRVDLCRVLALRGVVGADAGKIALARDALTPVFPYVTSGDGIYADGSIVQHTYVPYTGSYGAVLIDGLSRLFALLSDSPWAVVDPKRQQFLDSVEHSYAPFLFNGLMMDGVSGRAISRGVAAGDPAGTEANDHLRGHPVIASILLLGEGASAAERDRWRGLAKGWCQRDYYSPVLSDPSLSVGALARLKNVLDDTSVTPVPEPSGHRQFPGMDRVVHRRPGWAAALSMASRRITYYENGNGENVRGWHTGSGMLSWWGDTFANGQYSDSFWPTVDPTRLPGTTASRKKLADGQGGAWGAARPDVSWVGGSEADGYATAGQYLKGLASTLLAKKSWFFLDDAVVCLGAGITAKDGQSIETIVDNRNLGATGGAPLTVDDRPQPTAYPWSATLPGARWAHLAGHAGYVFPGGTTLKALREARTGAWRDINAGGSPTPVERRYLTLLTDHGTDPAGAGYAYVLLPGASAARTAQRAADEGWLRILANTDDIQGVSVASLGFTGVNFWFGGTAGPLTADAPASVTVHERSDGTAVIGVSDPMRARTALTLTWARPVAAVLSRPATLTAATTGSSLTLTFGDLRGTGGVTQRAVVRLG